LPISLNHAASLAAATVAVGLVATLLGAAVVTGLWVVLAFQRFG
jgi:hypothetical protein